jgi:hypothetical protein
MLLIGLVVLAIGQLAPGGDQVGTVHAGRGRLLGDASVRPFEAPLVAAQLPVLAHVVEKEVDGIGILGRLRVGRLEANGHLPYQVGWQFFFEQCL